MLTVIRYAVLGAPVLALLAALRWGADGRRDRAGAGLAFAAAFVGLGALQEGNRLAGWYTFAAVDGTFRGQPVDLWLGWAALWGPLPVLLRRRLPLPAALGALLWLDLLVMPRLAPLVHLADRWWVGEVAGLALVALPAQLLGRWTADDRRLAGRVLVQLATFTGLLLWLVPTVAFALGDGSWTRLAGTDLFLLAQVAGLLAVPALAAVAEFAVRGGGTPFPWDPPVRLVTTGPYAYLANPMQVSAVALLLLLAAAGHSWALAAGAVSATAFSVAVAGVHERGDLAARLGGPWHAYRRVVHDWLPRRTPYPAVSTAVLWLDADCPQCSAVGRFLTRRRPHGLVLAAAATHPTPLRRARYRAADGHCDDGVAAVARGLEHLGPGWAYVGWLLRLPPVRPLAQLLTDALLAAPGTRPY